MAALWGCAQCWKSLRPSSCSFDRSHRLQPRDEEEDHSCSHPAASPQNVRLGFEGCRAAPAEQCWDDTSLRPAALMAALGVCPWGRSYSASRLCKHPKCWRDEHADVWRSNMPQHFKSLHHNCRHLCHASRNSPGVPYSFTRKLVLTDSDSKQKILCDRRHFVFNCCFLSSRGRLLQWKIEKFVSHKTPQI